MCRAIIWDGEFCVLCAEFNVGLDSARSRVRGGARRMHSSRDACRLGKFAPRNVGCRGVRITTGCDLFSFHGQQNKSRSGALKASGLALKRDAERKVNKFHTQMAFIRLLSFIRDVRFLVATSVIYS